jgi:outer membrane protein OmpU
MKSILLASASIVAFAGAAAAEITWSGSATLGVNADQEDHPLAGADGIYGDHDGFYWSAGLTATFTQELNNGLTAGAKVSFDVADDENGSGDEEMLAGGFVLSLTSETAGLYFGDTETAQDKAWSGVGEMDQDEFSANDGANVLRGDVMVGGISASVSYFVDEDEDLVQLGLGATATFGNINLALAYQEEDACTSCEGDFKPDAVLGVQASTTLGGATLALGYASRDLAAGSENSIGVSASYPIGPVTLGAYYNMESVEDTDEYGISVAYASGPITANVAYSDDAADAEADWSIEGTYDVGNGIKAWAGLVDAGEDYYVAATVDMGNGASLLVSYANDGDEDEAEGDDDIGAPELQVGTTAEISFSF